MSNLIQLTQPDRLMTEYEFEDYVGYKRGVASRLRARGTADLPPHIRVGKRAIRYRLSAVEAYLQARTVIPGNNPR